MIPHLHELSLIFFPDASEKSKQPLLPRHLRIPAVPQRSASLTYSADDMDDPDEMTHLTAGYTSADQDSVSETSENICEIESDCETDIEGIISGVKGDKNTKV